MTDVEIQELKPNNYEPIEPVKYDQELYKKWFKAGGQAGFLSITPFFRDGRFVGRFIIDVGKVNPNSNQIESSTKSYVDGIDLYVYLDATTSGQSVRLYPKRSGTNSPESFIAYGGTPGADPVARVFKIEYWGSTKDKEGDPGSFSWKSGHFKGNVTKTGAITAIMSEPISTDMIKVTRLEMAEIAARIRLALHGFAAEDQRWYER